MTFEQNPRAQQILERAAQSGGDRVKIPDGANLTEAGEVVPSGHPDGTVVLTGPGGSLPADLAQELGLHPEQGAKPEAEPLVLTEPVADVALPAPAQSGLTITAEDKVQNVSAAGAADGARVVKTTTNQKAK